MKSHIIIKDSISNLLRSLYRIYGDRKPKDEIALDQIASAIMLSDMSLGRVSLGQPCILRHIKRWIRYRLPFFVGNQGKGIGDIAVCRNKENKYKNQYGQRNRNSFSSFRHGIPLSSFTGKHQASAIRCIWMTIEDKHSERKVRSDTKLTDRNEKLPSGFQPARTAGASCTCPHSCKRPQGQFIKSPGMRQ